MDREHALGSLLLGLFFFRHTNGHGRGAVRAGQPRQQGGRPGRETRAFASGMPRRMAPPGLGQGDSTRLVLSSRVDAAKPHQQKEDTPMDEQSFQDETPHGQVLEVPTDKPRSISEKKLEANRRNAQKSTGPITA